MELPDLDLFRSELMLVLHLSALHLGLLLDEVVTLCDDLFAVLLGLLFSDFEFVLEIALLLQQALILLLLLLEVICGVVQFLFKLLESLAHAHGPVHFSCPQLHHVVD